MAKRVTASRNEKEAGTQPGKFDLESFLPYRLSLLTNTISQGIAESYRDRHEISVTEWRVIAVLGRFPGLSASEVVERTAMDKVAVSRAVKSLVQNQLLLRTTDGSDRRKRRLYLTPGPGMSVLGEVVPLAREYEEALLASLSDKEVIDLLRIISRLQKTAARLNARKRESGGNEDNPAAGSKKSRE
jgi:DNA-binding MarR family transcriptional regulator